MVAFFSFWLLRSLMLGVRTTSFSSTWWEGKIWPNVIIFLHGSVMLCTLGGWCWVFRGPCWPTLWTMLHNSKVISRALLGLILRAQINLISDVHGVLLMGFGLILWVSTHVNLLSKKLPLQHFIHMCCLRKFKRGARDTEFFTPPHIYFQLATTEQG